MKPNHIYICIKGKKVTLQLNASSEEVAQAFYEHLVSTFKTYALQNPTELDFHSHSVGPTDQLSTNDQ